MIKMICAVGPGGEFGKEKGLPWDVPEDLAYFKDYTEDCILVMSRLTFESLPGKLPGRKHLVLSDSVCYAKNGAEPDFIIPAKTSLQGVCELLDHFNKESVCVIGGRKLLAEAAKWADAASVTEIDMELVVYDESMVFFDIHEVYQCLHEALVLEVTTTEYGRILEWS